MIALEIPYVLKRGRGYRYRRVIPPDVRENIKRKNWIKSWRPGTPLAVVEREARYLAAEHDHKIAVARGQALTPAQIQEAESSAREWLKKDKRERHGFIELILSGEPKWLSAADRAFISALENKGRYVPDSMSLSAALDRDTELYGQDRDARPFTQALNSFVNAVGDQEVTTITRADVSEWIKSMADLKPVTIRRRVGCLRAMVNRLYLDLDLDRRNPFASHSIKDGQGRDSDRLPFNKVMLDRIDSYLERNQRLGHETRNIMRLLKGTGAGPGEIGGLVLADVQLDSEVPYIWIRPNSLRGIKAAARDCKVPLIGEALGAARTSMEYARARVEEEAPDYVPLFKSFEAISGQVIKELDWTTLDDSQSHDRQTGLDL